MSCRHCLTIILHFSRKLTFTFSKIYFIESLSLYFLSTSLSHSTDNLASNLIGKIETIRWALFHNLITRSTKPSVPALISSFSPIIEVSLLLSAVPQYRSDSLLRDLLLYFPLLLAAIISLTLLHCSHAIQNTLSSLKDLP